MLYFFFYFQKYSRLRSNKFSTATAYGVVVHGPEIYNACKLVGVILSSRYTFCSYIFFAVVITEESDGFSVHISFCKTTAINIVWVSFDGYVDLC